jgi:hypothetical protein
MGSSQKFARWRYGLLFERFHIVLVLIVAEQRSAAIEEGPYPGYPPDAPRVFGGFFASGLAGGLGLEL